MGTVSKLGPVILPYCAEGRQEVRQESENMRNVSKEQRRGKGHLATHV